MTSQVDIEKTRKDLRATFRKWDIDPSEFEIMWEEPDEKRLRRPGAIVRYLRNGVWQRVTCYTFGSRAENLRQVYLLLDRLRIAEAHGVQYEGLTYTQDLVIANPVQIRREALLDAYDTLGVSPDDQVELIKAVYLRKSQFYHPDKGGDQERFKRLTKAYETVMASRGQKG